MLLLLIHIQWWLSYIVQHTYQVSIRKYVSWMNSHLKKGRFGYSARRLRCSGFRVLAVIPDPTEELLLHLAARPPSRFAERGLLFGELRRLPYLADLTKRLSSSVLSFLLSLLSSR